MLHCVPLCAVMCRPSGAHSIYTPHPPIPRPLRVRSTDDYHSYAPCDFQTSCTPRTSQIPKFPNSAVPQFPNSPIPQFLDSAIPQFRNFLIPQFPNSAIPQFLSPHSPFVNNSTSPSTLTICSLSQTEIALPVILFSPFVTTGSGSPRSLRICTKPFAAV